MMILLITPTKNFTLSLEGEGWGEGERKSFPLLIIPSSVRVYSDRQGRELF
jgi:hypothetical protein